MRVPESIKTERLLIRCPKVDDVPAVFAAIHESMPMLLQWMPWARENYSMSDCDENIRSAITQFMNRRDLRYHFHDKTTGELLVCSGLHRIDWDVPKAEIGYWCRSSKQGRGYVSEGVRALANTALKDLGMARVEIRCDDKNIRSYRVPERLGFVLEGVLKNDSRSPSGDLRDTRVYALTKAKQS